MPFVRWTACDLPKLLKLLAILAGVDGREPQSLCFDVAKLIQMLPRDNTRFNSATWKCVSAVHDLLPELELSTGAEVF